MPEPCDSTNAVNPGFWLRNCRRLSLWLSTDPVSRSTWVRASRILRQYWAGRIQSEVWAGMPRGLRVPVRLWDHVEAGIFWYGFPAEDFAAYHVLSAALPRDGVLLDIGANIGAFTLPLAARMERGTVHGFEPASGTVERLRRNLAINAIENVIVNRCAVSNRSGELSIWVPGEQWKGRLYNTGRTSAYVGSGDSGWRQETVPCITLDDYAARRALARVDAIKIDVEGGELDALEGASALIHKHRPMVVMEVNQAPLRAAGRSVEDVLAFWREHDYRVGTIAGNGRVRWKPPSTTDYKHRNICCVPRRSPDNGA